MGVTQACLTCRKRKVKCDRRFPRCATCTKLDTQCLTSPNPAEIRWLQPKAMQLSAAQNDTAVSLYGTRGPQFLTDEQRARHTAVLESAVEALSIEDLLRVVDERSSSLNVDGNFNAGPFSVIRLLEQPPEYNDSAAIGPSDTLTEIELEQLALNAPSLEFTLAQLGILSPTEQEMSLLIQGDFEADLSFGDEQLEVPVEQNNDISSYLSANMASFTSVPVVYNIDVSDLDFACIRLLLDRYRNSLVPGFAPAQIRSISPWEALHIPKVHETLGEVVIAGDSGNAKLSLLFSVLGASAYHLETLGCGLGNPGGSWTELGLRYRTRAKSRLKLSLCCLSSGAKVEDYKDMLLALLSMVTICVVSGDMQEAHAYLQDVERLINFYDIDNVGRSTGARLLHSTFLYLRTLQASVDISPDGQSPGQAGRMSPGLIDGRAALVVADPDKKLWTLLMQPQNDNYKASYFDGLSHLGNDQKSTFEQVYSLPEELFHHISRATTLARQMECISQKPKHLKSIQRSSLAEKVSELERDICDWKNDIIDCDEMTVQTTFHETSRQGPSRKLLYHFREAVHSALLIYFYRCVRNVDSLILQHHVEATIENLSRYAQEKRKSNDQSSNLCWPGFIAGCEALNPQTRTEMALWFSQETLRTGIRMFEIAGNAVQQVWNARDESKNRNLPWSKVLKEKDTLRKLVLS